jgi:tRNA(fMet)-specific endonuclease VapC
VGLVLDTSIIVDAQRGKLDLDFTLRKFAHTDILASAITVSELFLGIHFSREEFKQKRLSYVEGILEDLLIIDFDYELAQTHANISAQLRKEGNLIGPNDLIIAATCIHYQHSLLTFNIKEFSRVPNLKLASLD